MMRNSPAEDRIPQVAADCAPPDAYELLVTRPALMFLLFIPVHGVTSAAPEYGHHCDSGFHRRQWPNVQRWRRHPPDRSQLPGRYRCPPRDLLFEASVGGGGSWQSSGSE